MKLVVGLGNPDAGYARNRHNIGFMAADAIAAAHGFGPWRSKFQGQIAEGRLGPEKVMLLKPGTYMNLSGDSVRAALQFYKLEPGDVWCSTTSSTSPPAGCGSRPAAAPPGTTASARSTPTSARTSPASASASAIPATSGWSPTTSSATSPRPTPKTVDDLLAGVADGAPALAAGDTAGFLNAVARGLPPPQPPSPRAARPVAPPSPSRGTRAARCSGWWTASGEPGGAAVAASTPAAICAAMGSPFTARLCTLLGERLAPGGAVADRVLGWPGDPGGRADAVPLRLAGALHGLVIEGRDPRLAAVYPPHDADDDALWQAVSTALAAEAPYILRRLDGPPQTNEPQRSAALCPGFLTVAR